jgi:hypothetical protein
MLSGSSQVGQNAAGDSSYALQQLQQIAARNHGARAFRDVLVQCHHVGRAGTAVRQTRAEKQPVFTEFGHEALVCLVVLKPMCLDVQVGTLLTGRIELLARTVSHAAEDDWQQRMGLAQIYKLMPGYLG